MNAINQARSKCLANVRHFPQRILALTALAAAATIALGQSPVLVGTYATTPSGNCGLTVGIHWNDSATASGIFALEASSTNIVQVNALGGAFQVDDLPNALLLDTIDPGYDRFNDSYWLAGSGQSAQTPWAGVPPWGGVQTASGAPGQNTYRASYGILPSTPVGGTTPILYLVSDDPTGMVNITGDVARLGVDYIINQQFSRQGAAPVLAASGGNAGNVRIGTTGALSATVSNLGSAGPLDGTFPVASPEFSGGGSTFSLDPGASQDQLYGYSPFNHGADIQVVTVTSNGGTKNITLTGIGVGPEFDYDVDDFIDVGPVFFGPGSTTGFTINNSSPDAEPGPLTDMTITGVDVINDDGFVRFSTNLTPGTVLSIHESQLFSVTGMYGGTPLRASTGTLTIHTDVGAALGGDGADFSFQLRGFAVPEPSSFAMAAFAMMSLAGCQHGRRVIRRSRG